MDTLGLSYTYIDAFQQEWTSDIEKAVEALHYAQPNPCP